MKAVLLKCLYNPKEYKDTGLIEFAFAGRSNSGKSSTINALFHSNIAKVSKTPGKTKTVNLYNIDDKYVIADLPGYGYAKVGGDLMIQWKNLIEGYIENSKRLDTVFILSDVRRGLEQEEQMLIDWLVSLKKQYRIIFTKIDKISKSELALIKKNNPLHDLTFYFSAVTKEGRQEILKYLGGRCSLKK
ncbi:MAG: ribosome biogenesis GTP-binding protein YihA/YsxC [Proteobacteria bacterium]|nr:ribosome biogenesis GTP-binding protein YihA/YsxC [Pseudomonadota bacterium]